jgi:hypothetical protein
MELALRFGCEDIQSRMLVIFQLVFGTMIWTNRVADSSLLRNMFGSIESVRFGWFYTLLFQVSKESAPSQAEVRDARISLLSRAAFHPFKLLLRADMHSFLDYRQITQCRDRE